MSKILNYSDNRLKAELAASSRRLSQYEAARAQMPSSSVLGTLAISVSIKYEKKLIASLQEEIARRAGIENVTQLSIEGW